MDNLDLRMFEESTARHESDKAYLRTELKLAQATIDRLTVELAQSRAEAVAAYERAAQVCDDEADRILSKQDGKEPSVDLNLRFIALMLPEAANTIRALATEPGTTALAEMLDAETRACAELFSHPEAKMVRDRILARIDQRKEAGE